MIEQLQALAEKLSYRWSLAFRYGACPFGPEYQEAWNHRYELFSKFDRGIQTDAVGLYSVTPEKIAKQIANEVVEQTRGKTIVDAFCGIGGNAIAFAKVCPKVIAIDIDGQRLNMAQHNAGIYNRVNIEFLTGDFLQLAPSITADVVFLDPPWGGPDFIKKPEFLLSDFKPDGRLLLDTAFRYYGKVILRVPENFCMAELQSLNRPFTVQDNLLHGRLISRTVYFN